LKKARKRITKRKVARKATRKKATKRRKGTESTRPLKK